ncbi:hypothetical protein ABBQ32_004572 [Trebouxia sp. C0010 RCD-2024]
MTRYRKSVRSNTTSSQAERSPFFRCVGQLARAGPCACNISDGFETMADESDSWSMVDAEDEASRDRTSRTSSSDLSTAEAEGTASGVRHAKSRPTSDNEEVDLSASRGNDSPPRAAVLEAVAGTATEQSWSMASGLSRTPQAPESPASSSLSVDSDAPADIPGLATGTQACLQGGLEAVVQNGQFSSPSLSTSELPMSSVQTSSLVNPGPLPCLLTDLRDDDSFDDDESMSEESSGTAVMVGHPCSDEEDSAERRWRQAEQRGNDIRRASAPPCPRAMGTEGYLKVIVVGESGLGKTTFIENLRSAFQPDSPIRPRSPSGTGATENIYEVFEQSPEQLCTEVIIDNGSSKFHYLLQDTPGQIYGQTNLRIPDYIRAQHERYLAWEQSPERAVPMSAGDDHRVDACLFFLNPNHLKDAEVADMVHLSELVPVVPMIAKADIFTPSELSAFRAHVRHRLAEEEEDLGRPIMWRAAESKDQDEGADEGCRQPPFAVIASNNSDLAVGRFWPVRSYPWGKCEAFSSTNSDLASLKHLLFEEGFAGLKQATETRYYRYRASRLSLDAGKDAAAADLDDSDASSEASDMPQIMAGDPAEAAAADAFGELGQSQNGRRSWWAIGFLIAGILCGVSMISNMQLKADNRGLRKELALKEQAVPSMDANMPPIPSQTEQPLKGKGRYRVHVEGAVDKSASSQQGGGCTMLMTPWRHTVAVPAKHSRRPQQPAAAKNATEADNVMANLTAQGNAANNAVNASGSGTSEQAHLDKGPPQANTPASQRSLAVYTPTTIRKASSSVLQSVNQAAQVAGRQVSSAGAHSCMVVASAAHHSAHSTVAAAQAVMQFSQQLAGKTCSFGHRTGVAVYQGLEQASSGVALKQAALTRYTGRS